MKSALRDLNAAMTPEARAALVSMTQGEGRFTTPAWQERVRSGARTPFHEAAILLRTGSLEDDSDCGELLRQAAAHGPGGAHPESMDNNVVVAWKACGALHLGRAAMAVRGGAHLNTGETGNLLDRLLFGTHNSSWAAALADGAEALANSLARRALPAARARAESRATQDNAVERFQRRRVQDRITALGLDESLLGRIGDPEDTPDVLREATARGTLKQRISAHGARTEAAPTAPRETTAGSLDLAKAAREIETEGHADVTAVVADGERLRERINMFSLRSAAEMPVYSKWLNDIERAAVERAAPLDRADSDTTTLTANGMIANALKDANALARSSEPATRFLSGAVADHAEVMRGRFPQAADFIAAEVGAAPPPSDYPVDFEAAAASAWEGASSAFAAPDLNTNAGVETVRRGAWSFLSALDAKAYLFDAMGVKSNRPGDEWSDPEPRRRARHDSTQHTPLGRVVRGALSRAFPDHYAYEDHDTNGTAWAASALPGGALVTKNLTTADFLWFNTVMRHRPHAKMGNRLANPKTAGSVVRKIAMLVEAAHGTDHMISLHPRASELRKHSLRVEQDQYQTRTRRRGARETTPGAREAERRRLVESFVRDATEAEDLMSVASSTGTGDHATLDARVAQKLSESCNAGGDRRSWKSNGCTFEDAIVPSKPECAGCMACLGCDVRPPTCGAVGRQACETDADCAQTRHCDDLNCGFDRLIPDESLDSKARKKLADDSAASCDTGPHYTDAAVSIYVDTTASFETAMQSTHTAMIGKLQDYLMLNSSFYCGRADCDGKTDELCGGGGLLVKGEKGLYKFGHTSQNYAGYKDAKALDEWIKCQTVPGGCDKTVAENAFFDGLQRNCAPQDGFEASYVQRAPGGASNCGVTRNLDCYRFIAPLNIPYGESAAGFTCPCQRPLEGDLASFLPHSESCVCGDFADQPVAGGLDLTSPEFVADYVIYNFVLCNLYMQAEHACFPSVPFEIPVIDEWQGNVRETLHNNGINFTCHRQNSTDNATDKYGPLCANADVYPSAFCPEYYALINDDRAIIPFTKYLPFVHVTAAVRNRIVNTAIALQFVVRSLVQFTGAIGRSVGRVARAASRLLFGGFFAAPGLLVVALVYAGLKIRDFAGGRELGRRTKLVVFAVAVGLVVVENAFVVAGSWDTLVGKGALSSTSHDGLFDSLIAFPECDAVDHAAFKCRGAQCPPCCTQPYGTDCYATCTRSQFEHGVAGYSGPSTYVDRTDAKFWERCEEGVSECLHSLASFCSYPMRAHTAYATPLRLHRDCVDPDDLGPPANAFLCFWLQVGTVVWTGIGLAFLVAVWRATAEARGHLRNLFDQTFMKLWVHFIPASMHETLRTLLETDEVDIALRAHEVHGMRRAMNAQHLSPLQVARGLSRKMRGALPRWR